MKTKYAITMLAFCFLIVQSSQAQQQTFIDTIPFGGNAYTTAPAEVTDDGLTKWTNVNTVTSVYFRAEIPQTIHLSLRLQTPTGKSAIRISYGDAVFTKQISYTQFCVVDIGNITIAKPGYIKINIKGISKTGTVFANVSDLIIQYQKQDTALVYVKNGSSFHFGRRGPSVHLNFILPDEITNDVHWFYNELKVPVGQDKIGSYFMADGFGEGYFGMQVNSATERRILFSVWSPFETEDPNNIPDSLRIVLLQKGSDVHAGEFGNEGSGGQSYKRFMWKAGNTYAFLLGAQPDTIHHTTTYNAYCKDMSINKWYLIASFRRPQKATCLTHLYSFLENFIPESGDEERRGFYKNQWVMDGNGKWHELLDAKFTYDATAKSGYRKDYAGGADGDHFFLRNDGFFNEFVKPYQTFRRKSSGEGPVINFAELPNE